MKGITLNLCCPRCGAVLWLQDIVVSGKARVTVVDETADGKASLFINCWCCTWEAELEEVRAQIDIEIDPLAAGLYGLMNRRDKIVRTRRAAKAGASKAY